MEHWGCWQSHELVVYTWSASHCQKQSKVLGCDPQVPEQLPQTSQQHIYVSTVLIHTERCPACTRWATCNPIRVSASSWLHGSIWALEFPRVFVVTTLVSIFVHLCWILRGIISGTLRKPDQFQGIGDVVVTHFRVPWPRFPLVDSFKLPLIDVLVSNNIRSFHWPWLTNNIGHKYCCWVWAILMSDEIIKASCPVRDWELIYIRENNQSFLAKSSLAIFFDFRCLALACHDWGISFGQISCTPHKQCHRCFALYLWPELPLHV